MSTTEIKNQVSRETIAAFKAGVLGDGALEAAISHTILMVLQARQTGKQDAIPMDFDICNLRLDVFEEIAGRSAR